MLYVVSAVVAWIWQAAKSSAMEGKEGKKGGQLNRMKERDVLRSSMPGMDEAHCQVYICTAKFKCAQKNGGAVVVVCGGVSE